MVGRLKQLSVCFGGLQRLDTDVTVGAFSPLDHPHQFVGDLRIDLRLGCLTGHVLVQHFTSCVQIHLGLHGVERRVSTGVVLAQLVVLGVYLAPVDLALVDHFSPAGDGVSGLLGPVATRLKVLEHECRKHGGEFALHGQRQVVAGSLLVGNAFGRPCLVLTDLLSLAATQSLLALRGSEVFPAKRAIELLLEPAVVERDNVVDPRLLEGPCNDVVTRGHKHGADVGMLLAEGLRFVPVHALPVVHDNLATLFLGEDGGLDLDAGVTKDSDEVRHLGVGVGLSLAHVHVVDSLHEVSNMLGLKVRAGEKAQPGVAVQLVQQLLVEVEDLATVLFVELRQVGLGGQHLGLQKLIDLGGLLQLGPGLSALGILGVEHHVGVDISRLETQLLGLCLRLQGGLFEAVRPAIFRCLAKRHIGGGLYELATLGARGLDVAVDARRGLARSAEQGHQRHTLRGGQCPAKLGLHVGGSCSGLETLHAHGAGVEGDLVDRISVGADGPLTLAGVVSGTLRKHLKLCRAERLEDLHLPVDGCEVLLDLLSAVAVLLHPRGCLVTPLRQVLHLIERVRAGRQGHLGFRLRAGSVLQRGGDTVADRLHQYARIAVVKRAAIENRLDLCGV